MCKTKRWCLVGLLSVLMLLWMGRGEEAQSQEKYPTKSINILVPYSPGGGTDLTSRVAAGFLSKKWGVPVNVINKPGGGTLPATMELYRAAPDGYTMFGESQGSAVTLGQTQPDLPIKIMDRTFLSMTVASYMSFIVPSSAPYKNFHDAVNDAKRSPHDFTWISLGGGGGQDLIMRQLFMAIGVDVMKTQPVMAKGGAEGGTLIAGGNVKIMAGAPYYFAGPLKAGLIKVLATMDVERDPAYPEVPTMKELGYPGVNLIWWAGFSGPPKLPSHIANIWEKALQEMAKDPEAISQIKKVGKPFYLNSVEMREYVTKDVAEVKRLYPAK